MSPSVGAPGPAHGPEVGPREGDIVERPCASCGAPVRLWWSSSVGDYPVYHGGCFAPAPACPDRPPPRPRPVRSSSSYPVPQ